MKSPWDYRVQLVLPHIDTIEQLEAIIPLWNLQTVVPWICVVDTGTSRDQWDRLLDLTHKYSNVEVHFVCGREYFHASEPVSTALDVATARCQQEYQLHSHVDVAPMSRLLVETWMAHCVSANPVVGFEISPRDEKQGKLRDMWRGMVGHTITMLHMPTIDQQPIPWRLTLGHQQFGMDESTDTEVPFNLHLREQGIEPLLLGSDINYERQTNEWFDHCRSYPSSKMYSPSYFATAEEWMKDWLQQARLRAAQWQLSDRTEAQ